MIGSECDAAPPLGFTDDLAVRLCSALHRLGGWEPTPSSGRPLLDPTVAELKSAIREAFAVAADQQATLLISFIGHGVAVADRNFYLLAKDSPRDLPDSESAYNLGPALLERLAAVHLDGLVVLVDACEAGIGARAAHSWINLLNPVAGRMELLVAADTGSAYDGCFTRTILDVFDRGLPQHGANLLPADLRSSIAARCHRQIPRQLSSAVGGDAGLWLVPNAARRNDAVRGRPAAGLVDQLTDGLAITPELRAGVADVFNADEQRLRVVTGPAGCGKSTLLSVLIRPGLLDGVPFTSEYVTAAVFLDISSTIETVVAELTSQLRRRVANFADTWADSNEFQTAELDLVERAVLRPLSRVEPLFGRITIVVDGLDQPESGTRALLVDAIARATTRRDLAHVGVIVGVRQGAGPSESPRLGHQHRTTLQPPTASEIVEVVRASTLVEASVSYMPVWIERTENLLRQTTAGGWLLARLLIELTNTDRIAMQGAIRLDSLVAQRIRVAVRAAGSNSERAIVAIAGLIAAAGTGPVLPLEILTTALRILGITLRTPRIRDLVVELGVLISRGNPGTDEETFGLVHEDFVAPVQTEQENRGLSVAAVHRALARAIDHRTTDITMEYARSSAVRHYLANKESAAALSFLEQHETPRAADNRDLWATWLASFTAQIGWDHPDTLIARHRLAYWRGESGDPHTAVTELETVLAARIRRGGPLHPETLDTRFDLARWRGHRGDIRGAIAEFERLLADQLRVFGADHPATLSTRHSVARWRGKNGEPATAARLFEQILLDRVRVLGPDHPDVLATRQNIARWHADSGDVRAALAVLEALLQDRIRVLGPDHSQTLATRYHLARCRGLCGDITRAVDDAERLLLEQLRVLGSDHLDTLATRHHIALWRGEGGDRERAVAELTALLADMMRELGRNHPHTLITRQLLVRWTVRGNDPVAVRIQFDELLRDHLEVLGPDHPETLAVRRHIAHWLGMQGEPVPAMTELQQLLDHQLRVLGHDHPETRSTRNELTSWRRRLSRE
ncbi:tetratricopeptide repeat protein [Nocardia brasiliensis]|uniref:tetratricopeptide repeat protein n=1 Tax=Nocardia brasiliensis TaxID=37326 RepID=UPI0024541F8F|nr:tetratricopeptide repeat protein [Nocardia brasiliensis]